MLDDDKVLVFVVYNVDFELKFFLMFKFVICIYKCVLWVWFDVLIYSNNGLRYWL